MLVQPSGVTPTIGSPGLHCEQCELNKSNAINMSIMGRLLINEKSFPPKWGPFFFLTTQLMACMFPLTCFVVWAATVFLTRPWQLSRPGCTDRPWRLETVHVSFSSRIFWFTFQPQWYVTFSIMYDLVLLSSNRALMHNDLLPFSTTIGTVLNGTSSLSSVIEVTNVLVPGSPSVQFLGEIVFVLPIVSVWGSSGKLCFTKIPLCPPLRGKRSSLEGHPLIGQRLALLHVALLWELEK